MQMLQILRLQQKDAKRSRLRAKSVLMHTKEQQQRVIEHHASQIIHGQTPVPIPPPFEPTASSRTLFSGQNASFGTLPAITPLQKHFLQKQIQKLEKQQIKEQRDRVRMNITGQNNHFSKHMPSDTVLRQPRTPVEY